MPAKAPNIDERRVLDLLDQASLRFEEVLARLGLSGGCAGQDGRALDRLLQRLRRGGRIRFHEGRWRRAASG